MSTVDFTSGAKPTVDFTKPIQAETMEWSCNDVAYTNWKDAVYIGPYEGKHVIADSKGEYHTVHGYQLRNKPTKPSTKEMYNSCVQAALADGFGWASQETILDLLYGHLVLNGLIKKEK